MVSLTTIAFAGSTAFSSCAAHAAVMLALSADARALAAS